VADASLHRHARASHPGAWRIQPQFKPTRQSVGFERARVRPIRRLRGRRASFNNRDSMRLFSTTPAALLALALATPALAQRAVNLQDAVERVQRQTAGRILSAETVRSGRQKLYRVKVLTPEGRVQVVTVPAAGAREERKD
jgi:hypothetical protein